MALATWLWMSCGEVYRPVVIPTTLTPPNPANFHEVFSVNTNVPFNQGTALQIDVSGDSEIGAANMGVNPTHAAILPNNSRVFVASAGSLYAGDSDVVTSFTPASDSRIATGLGTPQIFTYPNVGVGQSSSIVAISESGNVVTVTLSTALSNAAVGMVINISSVSIAGYNGNFLISFVNGTTIEYQDSNTGLAAASNGNATVPVTCSYLPDYVATAQNSAVFVANYGVENAPNCNLTSTDSVALLSPVLNIITNIGYLPAGSHPVAMTETPNALNLYVVNQAPNSLGFNTVTNLSPTDLSVQATINLGNVNANNMPTWAATRPDGQRVYVLTQGDGQLYTINTATNTVMSNQSVGGAGANFVLYDESLNRLYVTNPTAGVVYIFDATTDPPTQLAALNMSTGSNPPCPNGCSPVSVAALPDGSRFYVASYATASSCPDTNVGASVACLIPMLTVFDAPSMTVKPAASTLLPTGPSLSLLTSPQFAATQYAVPVVPSCVPVATYAPGSTRFRIFTTAAADGSHVYVAICDAGAIADIITTTTSISVNGNVTDTLVTDLLAPFSAAAPVPPSIQPVPQSPVFLLTGQ
jgi:YVTN family beta-propeller protein